MNPVKRVVYDPCEDLIAKITSGYPSETMIRNDEGVLDPIPEGLTGSIDLRRIDAPPTSPIGRAKQLLFDPQNLNRYLDRPRKQLKFVPTSRKYMKFVDEMILASLCSKKPRNIRESGFAKFFTIVKKVNDDGINVLRTILDCQTANEFFTDPDPVNLSTLQEMLEAFRSVEKLRTLDLRHMYHQILIGDHLRKWFTLAIGSLRLLWNALPMGWKWACFVAQAFITYAVAGDTGKTWSEIPRSFREGKIIVFCVYDNVVAAGPSLELDPWWDRFLARLQALGAIVKESSEAIAGSSIATLGLEWFPDVAGLTWTFLPKFIEKLNLAAKILDTETVLTAKEIAGFLGLVAWGRYATHGHLFDMQPAYRRLADVVQGGGWQALDNLIFYRMVSGALNDLATSGIHSFSKIQEEVLVFSDAHVSGYGFVGGFPLSFCSREWPTTFTSADMFYLEAVAAKQAILKFARPQRKIYLAVDNMALMFAIRKRSTSCPRTAKVLRELFDHLKTHGSLVEAGWISTDLNPADELSRGKHVVVEKILIAARNVEWTGRSAQWGSKLGRVVG